MNKTNNNQTTDIKYPLKRAQEKFKERRRRFCGYCDACTFPTNCHMRFNTHRDPANIGSSIPSRFHYAYTNP